MAKKLYDLAIKIGSYTKDGIEKGRYENVGSVMENDEGGRFIFIKRSFNPAGVPFREGTDSIILSMFKPKGQDENRTEPTPPSPPGDNKENPFSDDEIPF